MVTMDEVNKDHPAIQALAALLQRDIGDLSEDQIESLMQLLDALNPESENYNTKLAAGFDPVVRDAMTERELRREGEKRNPNPTFSPEIPVNKQTELLFKLTSVYQAHKDKNQSERSSGSIPAVWIEKQLLEAIKGLRAVQERFKKEQDDPTSKVEQSQESDEKSQDPSEQSSEPENKGKLTRWAAYAKLTKQLGSLVYADMAALLSMVSRGRASRIVQKVTEKITQLVDRGIARLRPFVKGLEDLGLARKFASAKIRNRVDQSKLLTKITTLTKQASNFRALGQSIKRVSTLFERNGQGNSRGIWKRLGRRILRKTKESSKPSPWGKSSQGRDRSS